jgi:hypothetical protein
VRGLSEILVVDHSTTQAESATRSGGVFGHGGEILYRWGNPQNYGAGEQKDRRLYGQHDAQWVPAGFPNAGGIVVFNNGEGRFGGNWSSVERVTPILLTDGSFAQDQGAFLPVEADWSWSAEEPTSFYEGFMSGTQPLPNGNVLASGSMSGFVYEIDGQGAVVWSYLNPTGEKSLILPEGRTGSLFRARRLAACDEAILALNAQL